MPCSGWPTGSIQPIGAEDLSCYDLVLVGRRPQHERQEGRRREGWHRGGRQRLHQYRQAMRTNVAHDVHHTELNDGAAVLLNVRRTK